MFGPLASYVASQKIGKTIVFLSVKIVVTLAQKELGTIPVPGSGSETLGIIESIKLLFQGPLYVLMTKLLASIFTFN